MSLPPSSLTIACCFLLTILFVQSSVSQPNSPSSRAIAHRFLLQFTYITDSNDLSNHFIDQEFGLNIPSYFYDRNSRATKFPRIGRAVLTTDEFASESEESVNDLVRDRSVLFPRIGKRAFHNLLWANSRSNPHRMLDSQGRHYLNGYDYHVHHVRPSGLARYRAKRSLSM